MIEFLSILSGITDVFVEGTSPVRPLLLILFGAAAFLFAFVPTVVSERLLKRAAVVSLTVLFALTLSLQVYVAIHAGIPQHALSVALADGEITNSRLTHIHIGKAGLAVLLTPIGSVLVESVDTGSAAQLLIPSAFSILLAVLIVATGVLLVYALSRLLRNSEKGIRKWSLLALLTVAGFVALTKAVDGGICSDAAIIAYAAVVALLLGKRRDFTTYLSCGAIASAIAIAILHLSGLYWGEGNAMSAVLKSIALVSLLLTLHYAANGVRTIRILGVGLLTVIFVGVLSVQPILDRQAYLQTEIGEGTSLIRLSDGRVVSGDTYIGMRIEDVVRSEGLHYWYQPITYREDGCTADTAYVGSFTLAPRYVPAVVEAKTEYGLARYVLEGDRYVAEVSLHPCVPERIVEIQQLLGASGLEQAVIYGLEGRLMKASNGDNEEL